MYCTVSATVRSLSRPPDLHDGGDQALADRLPRRHAVDLDRAGSPGGTGPGSCRSSRSSRPRWDPGTPSPPRSRRPARLPARPAPSRRTCAPPAGRRQAAARRHPGAPAATAGPRRPGLSALTARRRGQRPGVLTHPGRLCHATTTGRKSPCDTCAPCHVPDRQEHHNDHDDQLDTHPDTSWRARGLGAGGAYARDFMSYMPASWSCRRPVSGCHTSIMTRLVSAVARGGAGV